jgi:hypothetical protein
MQDSLIGAAGIAVGLSAVKQAAAEDKPEVDAKKILNYNPNMEYRRLGKTGLWVSAVAMGGHWKRVDKILSAANKTFDQNCHDIVTRCIEVGIVSTKFVGYNVRIRGEVMRSKDCSKCCMIAPIISLILLSPSSGNSTSEPYSELLREAVAELCRGPDGYPRRPELLPPARDLNWAQAPPRFRPSVEGLDDANAVPFLIKAVYEGLDWDANVPYGAPKFQRIARRYAVLSLAASGDLAAFDVLTDILHSDANSVNWDLAGESLALLIEDMRLYGAAGLGILGEPNAVDHLLSMLGDDNRFLKHHCLWSLAKIGDLRAIKPMLDAALADKEIDGLTLHSCLQHMTKAEIESDYSNGGIIYKDFPELGRLRAGTAQYKKLWQHWLKVRETWTEREFEKRYERWLKGRGDSQDERRLRGVGITALPLIIEKVEQGEAALIPVVSRLVDQELPQVATQQECLTWWQKNKDRWLIPSEEEKNQEKTGNQQLQKMTSQRPMYLCAVCSDNCRVIVRLSR